MGCDTNGPMGLAICGVRQEDAAASPRCHISGDIVHGSFSLPSYCNALIQSAPFKRLDRLKQLGLAYHAFPGAVHTRYQHSLGVAYLGNKVVRHLHDTQRGELELDERSIRHITLAGLCHDLGHGVCSHVFERELLDKRMVIKWEHEAMSLQLLDYLADECGIEALQDREDRVQIGKYIKGCKPSEREKVEYGKRFLYDIISNDCNGLDVDRLDYLSRDAAACGAQLQLRTAELLAETKVLRDQVCYPAARCGDVWAAYEGRGRMFRDVYTHSRTKAAELMVVDALEAADRALRFTALIHSPQDFLMLDDGLLDVVRTYDTLSARSHPHLRPLLSRLRPLEEAEGGDLRKAQEVLRKLQAGEYYPCAGEITRLPYSDELECQLRRHFTPEELYGFLGSSRGAGVVQGLTPGQLLPHVVDLDCGKKGVNPLQTVGFYRPGATYTTAPLPPQDDMMAEIRLPACFKERTLRLYVRTDPRVTPAAAEALASAAFDAFAAWAHHHRGWLGANFDPVLNTGATEGSWQPRRVDQQGAQDTVVQKVNQKAYHKAVQGGTMQAAAPRSPPSHAAVSSSDSGCLAPKTPKKVQA